MENIPEIANREAFLAGSAHVLTGRFRVLLLYDVAEALDLQNLQSLLGPRCAVAPLVFSKRTPEYVRFEHPPIVEPVGDVTLKTGEVVSCSIRYYGFAAVIVEFEIPFRCGWQSLLTQGSRWIEGAGLEAQGREIVSGRLESLKSAVIHPSSDWLQDNYLLIELKQIASEAAGRAPAEILLATHGPEIVELILGESALLDEKLSDDILQNRLSYYASDLVVAGALAALVYDPSEDAVTTMQVLEYAKMQLLEFRYYDGVMSRVLAELYDVLDEDRNPLLSRWTIPRDAKRFNTVRLDVMELTERIDNAIKFTGDAYYARLYRLAAARMSVNDYRTLVEEKLKTISELYDVMVAQFNEARSFVLEVGIAILALIDVILLFRGK